jgi:hypothetical protein
MPRLAIEREILIGAPPEVVWLLPDQPAVRESLPLVTAQNAASTGTGLEGYFSEGHGISTFASENGTVYH